MPDRNQPGWFVAAAVVLAILTGCRMESGRWTTRHYPRGGCCDPSSERCDRCCPSLGSWSGAVSPGHSTDGPVATVDRSVQDPVRDGHTASPLDDLCRELGFACHPPQGIRRESRLGVSGSPAESGSSSSPALLSRSSMQSVYEKLSGLRTKRVPPPIESMVASGITEGWSRAPAEVNPVESAAAELPAHRGGKPMGWFYQPPRRPLASVTKRPLATQETPSSLRRPLLAEPVGWHGESSPPSIDF